MPQSIFDSVLIKAAKLTSGVPEVEKQAFVDAGTATGAPPPGGDPSQGGAPPPGGDPSGGAPPPGGDPAQAGGAPDPMSVKLDQVLQVLQMQQMAGGGGAKPGGGGKKSGGGGEMQYNIILKLLARICDALQVPVSLEELLTQEQQVAAMQAQAQAGMPPAGGAPPAAAGADPTQGGGNSIMGSIAPPSTVAPMTSIAGSPPAGGAAPGGPPAAGATKSGGDYGGITISPETLSNLDAPRKTKLAGKKRDIIDVLRGVA